MKISILLLSLLFMGACSKDSIPVGKTETELQLLTGGTSKAWAAIQQGSANTADHWVFSADSTFEIYQYQFHGELGGWPSNSIVFISGKWKFSSNGQSIECSDITGSNDVNSTFTLGILALTDNNLQLQPFDFYKSAMNDAVEFEFSAGE